MTNDASNIPVSYKSTDLQESDFSIFLEVAAGLGGMAALRGDDVTVPGRPGKAVRNRIPETLELELRGVVKGEDMEDLRSLIMTLQTLFRPAGGPGALEIELEDGTELEANARALNMLVSDQPGFMRRVSVQMEAVDPPYWLGEEVVDDPAEAVTASPHDWSITNPGTEVARNMVVTFVGPITNPRIENTTLGVWVEVLVDLAGAEVLEIDTQAFTATVDDVSVLGSVRHSGAREWLLVAPGANSFEVTSTAPGGTVSVAFRPPYL